MNPHRDRVAARAIAFAVALTVVASEAAHAQRAPGTSTRLDSTITTYCAAWSTPDRDVRERLLTEVWASDGSYSDPTPTSVTGRAALSATIDAFQRQSPRTTFRCSGAQTHHDVLRFTWRMVGPDGASRGEGMDFAEFAADGRLRRIVGFFGALPVIKP